MIVVNLFGVPGVDSGAGAAYVFSSLRFHGIKATLISLDSIPVSHDQLLSHAADMHQTLLKSSLHGIDVVITDSSLIYCALNNASPFLGDPFSQVVRHLFDSYDNMNYLIGYQEQRTRQSRLKPDTDRARQDRFLRQQLSSHHVLFTNIKHARAGYDRIVSDVLNRIYNPSKKKQEEDED